MITFNSPEIIIFRFKIWIVAFIIVSLIYGVFGTIIKASWSKLIPLGMVILFFSLLTVSALVFGVQLWISIIFAIFGVAIAIPYMKGLRNINEVAIKEKMGNKKD